VSEHVQQLAREASAGSIKAFDELVSIFSARIFAFCRSKSANSAGDLAQEIFVTAFRRLNGYNCSRPFGPWLFSVARSVAIDVSRRRILPCAEDGSEPVYNKTPADEVSSIDAERAVWNIARNTLTERQLQVLEMRAGAGLSIAETAAATGLTQAAVKVILFRARRALILAGADQPLRQGLSTASSTAVERGYI